MRVHKVTQCEDIHSIAAQYRIADWQAIYNHDANERLRQFRPDPNDLHPGDIVYIPDTEPLSFKIATDQSHTIKIPLPKVQIHLEISDGEGPQEDMDYLLTFPGGEIKNKTTASGAVIARVPAHVTQATVTFFPIDLEPRTYSLSLCGMNPKEEISGIQARLQNLGYYNGQIDEDYGYVTFEALAKFQDDHGLTPTGQPDQVTLDLINPKYTA